MLINKVQNFNVDYYVESSVNQQRPQAKLLT